ncbi:MAG TPA: hypothetical protein VFX50_18870 [Gemmatimonadales bacterium]|nr:hypothetical protein [Gemmatimonadales bacterium]
MPRDLAALDRELRATQFGPRASLGVEIAGRAARGEVPMGPRRREWRLVALLVLLGVALVGAGVTHVLRWSATRDLCCGDLDGSAFVHDGVLVTTDWRGEIQRLVVYEDRDGTGSLSVGDVLYLDSPSTLQADPTLARAFTARTHCCADFDGQGEDDDGVVVGVSDGKIVMATVFQAGRKERNPRRD